MKTAGQVAAHGDLHSLQPRDQPTFSSASPPGASLKSPRNTTGVFVSA